MTVDFRSAADRYWLAVKRLAHHIGGCPCGDDIGLSCTEGDRLLEAVYRAGTAAHDERRRAGQWPGGTWGLNLAAIELEPLP